MAANKLLSADHLFALVRANFEQVTDERAENAKVSMPDALMSGFAMFSLKDSSLLAFDERRTADSNMGSIYGIKEVPGDTQMRTILDAVDPTEVSAAFRGVVRQLERTKELDKFVFLGESYLVSLDGTGYFSSKTIHSSSCMQKVNKKTGEVTYYHQLMGGVIIHPNLREVIPLMPEPILKQDGETKNDCERNAAKRFLAQLKQDYPDLTFTITEDALSPNAPHIRELEKHGFHYILGVKEGDHKHLFEQVTLARQEGRTTEYERRSGGIVHRFSFVNRMPLNKSNPDVLVNFVEYWEIGKDKTQHFCWVTDFTITKLNVFTIMRGGRARWKVENETFNTLKNQGYHFEHNFGHGKKNLSVVFVALMMLAFLVDQVQQLACELFQAVLKKKGSRRRLWEHMRALFKTLEFQSMAQLFEAILYGYKATVVIFSPP
ncbi:MAG: transposase [Deltaproteobacteria bacterium]|nr:transposase [Deltaproteobacteria bacterium]